MSAGPGEESSADRVARSEGQRHQRWTTPCLVLASVGAVVYLLRVGRSTTFFFDEWEFVIHRSGELERNVIAPHVGHPSVVPVAIYRALFATVGIRHYLPYRLALLALHVIVSALLFVFARRRVPPPVALALAVALLFFGSAWNDLIWPFQIGYLASLAGLMGALLFLDRADLVGDAGACGCLVVAVTSSSLGLPALAAVAIQIALSQRRLRRCWVVVAPVLAYAAFVLTFPGGAGISGENIGQVPGYVRSAAVAVVSALFGTGAVISGVVLGVGLAAAALQAWRDPDARSRLAVVGALPLSFWVLTGLARADLGEPGASRYLYPGALFLFLVTAEVVRPVQRIGRAAVAGLGVLVAVSVAVNVDPLLEGKRFLTQVSVKLRAELAALEIARPAVVDPNVKPEPVWAPDITAARYYEVVDRLGSPTYGEDELARRSKVERYDADRVSFKAGTLLIGPDVAALDEAAPAPTLGPFVQGAVGVDGACTTVTAGSDAVTTVMVPPSGLVVSADAGGATVSARRFGDEYSIEPIAELEAGTSTSVLPVTDRSRASWHLLVRGRPAVTVCTATAPHGR